MVAERRQWQPAVNQTARLRADRAVQARIRYTLRWAEREYDLELTREARTQCLSA